MIDYREKDGYSIESVDVYGMDGGHEKVVVPEVNGHYYIIPHNFTSNPPRHIGYCKS